MIKITLRKDWEEQVTPEETTKHREIIEKANQREYLFKEEAEFLLKYDKKTRSCGDCGKSHEDIMSSGGAWMYATAPDRYGNDLNIGLFLRCFKCSLLDAIKNRSNMSF